MAFTIGHSRQLSSTATYPDANRRRLQISDASSYDGPVDDLSLIAHTFEKNRVGAPPLLLLPLASSEIDERSEIYRKYIAHQVQDDIETILRRYDIEVSSRELYTRFIEDTPITEGFPTLYIETTEDLVFDAAKQRKCVAELYHMFRGMNLSGPTRVITVEIVGHKLWAPKEITLVEADHPFHKLWESELLQTFSNLLDIFPSLHGKILSVDLVRLGHDLEDRSSNPLVISITTDWTVDPPQYESIERGLKTALQESGFTEVEVQFERGTLVIGVTHEPSVKMLTLAEAQLPFIRPGSSISCGKAENIAGPPALTGTVGIVVELHKPGSTKVEATLALTNHHVVRTGLPGFNPPQSEGAGSERKNIHPPATANSVCSKLDTDGFWAPPENFGLGIDVLPIMFRSPSQRVLSTSLEKATKLFEEKRNEKPAPNINASTKKMYEDQLEEARTLVETLRDPKYPVQQLGSIFYSGGFSRKHCEGGRLDVAGVFLDGDVLDNSSNDISHWRSAWEYLHSPLSDKITEIDLSFGKNWEDTEEGEESSSSVQEVYKVGAMTGCTHAIISPRKSSNVILVSDTSKHTWSYEITAVGEKGLTAAPFSWKGDSGSAIFDKHGRWLGLLYGGQVKLNTIRPLTYVIPAWAIVDDIRTVSKLECRLKV